MATGTKTATARKTAAAGSTRGKTGASTAAKAAPKATKTTKSARTRKAATAPAPSVEIVAEVPAPLPEPAAVAPDPAAAAPEAARARRGDLLDAVVERSPMRRPDLKPVVELVLEEIGRLLDAGEEVVVPPLGKLSVKKRVAKSGGDLLTLKLKRPAPGERSAD
jgi:nucleoid DNA-binding protein